MSQDITDTVPKLRNHSPGSNPEYIDEKRLPEDDSGVEHEENFEDHDVYVP